jgi:hypothetical protein
LRLLVVLALISDLTTHVRTSPLLPSHMQFSYAIND